MSAVSEVMVKLALLPEILKAAQLLHDCGLIKQPANEVIKLYIKKNPDINEHIAGLQPKDFS